MADQYYPRFPPTLASQHPPETQSYAQRAEDNVFKAFGENGSLITYQHPNGGLIGPFPIIIASKEIGESVLAAPQTLAKLSTIPDDAKEVAILVVGAKFDCAYEQYAHRNIATKKSLLTEQQCADIRAQRKPEGLSEAASVTYDAAFHLANQKGPLPTGVFKEWVKALGSKESMLVMTHYIGIYCHVCVLMNMADTPLPPGETH
ncbi:Hypothetical predicted protein [Lecanosticta acicola]|uniref:Carboxymuconolactone decarboxylase-like domain-containing protein n=1 Tax=Lecanosticta acicola TaxID=111012 RepID=A0AAI8Z559_9PEZI|nr:Hypothetical predicted protein [Lecanosticta acicola]